MKTVFIQDARQNTVESHIDLFCWLGGRRVHGKVLFLTACDSTGTIQVVVEVGNVPPEQFELAKRLTLESAVHIHGILKDGKGGREIHATDFAVVSAATKKISPSPRSSFDIEDTSMADHLLQNRHLYIRNPSVITIMQYRDLVLHETREWFYNNRFVELTAPILTRLPLYDDRTALNLEVHGEKVFLTQCVGFYMEASVHGLERAYNIGPSFRGEEGRSKRHLMEYWHVKAEAAWGNREDIMMLVENYIAHMTVATGEMAAAVAQKLGTTPSTDGTQIPFPRISYRDAVTYLSGKGFQMQFGKSMGSAEEGELSKLFPSPFWIVGIPRSIEPFPYVIDPNDHEVTMTADLIASHGQGELLGVAEKITDMAMLVERMKEKGKDGKPDYEWLKELRQFGCVPHIGFGMGIERYMRWMLGATHVRDMIPFPRSFGRQVFP